MELSTIPKALNQKIHLKDPSTKNPYTSSCRLLRDLYPTTIILRDNYQKGLDLTKGSIPASLWKCTEELVFVTKVWGLPSLEREPITEKIPITLQNLDHLTWIFLPLSKDKEMVRINDQHRPDYYNATQIAHLVLQLENTRFTIVNVGITGGFVIENQDSDMEQLHYEAKEFIFDKIASEARKLGWNERKIREVQNKVDVVTMEEYRDSQVWVGKFGEDEVDSWVSGNVDV